MFVCWARSHVSGVWRGLKQVAHMFAAVNQIQMELASARVAHLQRRAQAEKNKPHWLSTREPSESSVNDSEVRVPSKLVRSFLIRCLIESCSRRQRSPADDHTPGKLYRPTSSSRHGVSGGDQERHVILLHACGHGVSRRVGWLRQRVPGPQSAHHSRQRHPRRKAFHSSHKIDRSSAA